MVSSVPETPAAGVSWRSVPSARARATAGAFSSPLTRNQTALERLRAPKVRLMRSGAAWASR